MIQPKPGAVAAAAFCRAWNRHFHAKKEITVEGILVWAYKAQKVIEITGRSLYAGEAVKGERYVTIQKASGDGCIAVERNGQLGCPIDGGGPIRGIPQPLHPDAETIHEIVLTLPWDQSALLIQYGRAGIAPELPGSPKLVKVLVEAGDNRYRVKIKNQYDFWAKCTLQSCPVVVDWDERDREVAVARRVAWFRAMDAFYACLGGVELQDHEVIGVGTPFDISS